MLNMKLRKFLDGIGWPLVTRKRYALLKYNFEQELDHAEQVNDMLRAALKAERAKPKPGPCECFYCAQKRMIEKLQKSAS